MIQSEFVQHLFASPVFKSRIVNEQLIEDITNEILSIKEKNQGKTCIETQTFITRDDLQNQPGFKPLCDLILLETSKALDYLSIDRDEHYISCMWSNVSPIGVAHMEHTHYNSIVSGVLYLQVPAGSGSTYFADPRPGTNVLVPKYNKADPTLVGARCTYPPERGAILIFPSWLPHGVYNSKSDPTQLRITLSFNIMIKAKVDVFTAGVEFK